jgi:hypothetical protein
MAGTLGGRLDWDAQLRAVQSVYCQKLPEMTVQRLVGSKGIPEYSGLRNCI